MSSLFAAVKMVLSILSIAKELKDFIEANRTEAWFKESAEAFKGLRAAQTPEEKKDAAKRLRDLIAGI